MSQGEEMEDERRRECDGEMRRDEERREMHRSFAFESNASER